MSKTILMNGQVISPQELVSKVAIPHGNDAFSPTVSIDKIDGGHRVTIVDINGSKSFDVLDGKDGTDGVSPTIDIEEIDNGYKLIIKDVNSERSINVLNGQNGKDGKPFTYDDFTPEQLAGLKGEKGEKGDKGADGKNGVNGTDGKDGIGISDVTVLSDGTLTITLSDGSTKSLGNIKGEKGDKGEKGADGNDGISPSFSIEEKDNGYSLTITAKDKSETIEIKNGNDGAQGIPGTNGTTPVKGVDYFTESDVSEIVASVVAALPKYNGEVITL